MIKMNLGCGPDIKDATDGWTNVDTVSRDGVWVHDAREAFPQIDAFDFVLINHTLCTMTPSDAKKVLENVYTALKPGGRVQVIDVDIDKAINAYKFNQGDLFPVDGRTIDEQFLMHVSGYGTRLSLYNHHYLSLLLKDVGFGDVIWLTESEYDLRPKESLVVEGIK